MPFGSTTSKWTMSSHPCYARIIVKHIRQCLSFYIPTESGFNLDCILLCWVVRLLTWGLHLLTLDGDNDNALFANFSCRWWFFFDSLWLLSNGTWNHIDTSQQRSFEFSLCWQYVGLLSFEFDRFVKPIQYTNDVHTVACFIFVLQKHSQSNTCLSIEKMIMFDFHCRDMIVFAVSFTIYFAVVSQEQSSWIFVSLCWLLLWVLRYVGLVQQWMHYQRPSISPFLGEGTKLVRRL